MLGLWSRPTNKSASQSLKWLLFEKEQNIVFCTKSNDSFCHIENFALLICFIYSESGSGFEGGETISTKPGMCEY